MTTKGPDDRPRQEPARDPTPGWEDELEKYRDRFIELRKTPVQLLDALRKEPDFRVAATRADCLPRLRTWFTPTGGAPWNHEPERSGPLGEQSVTTEWHFEGVHDVDKAFNGLPPTGRPVVVRGVTHFSAEDAKLVVRRYVDWAGLYGQLGLSLNWRVPMRDPGAPPLGR